jgi:hypothetical protein
MRPIFLDDIRVPRSSPPSGWWVVLRDAQMTKDYILEHGCPDHISFDHDLGDPKAETGYDVAKWLVEMDLDKPGFLPENFTFAVHSANPVGAKNIREYLTAYLGVR